MIFLADDLLDVANAMDIFAEQEDKQARLEVIQKAKEEHKGAARAYRHVAEILRSTRLKNLSAVVQLTKEAHK